MYDCVYPTRTARFGTALVPEVCLILCTSRNKLFDLLCNGLKNNQKNYDKNGCICLKIVIYLFGVFMISYEIIYCIFILFD